MLKQVKSKLDLNAEFIKNDMLSFLEGCQDNSYDIVICAWAIKYQNPRKIIKEVSRVLNNNGVFAVTGNFLPCDFVPEVFGNVLSEDVKDIWNKMHSKFERAKPYCYAKGCSKCSDNELPKYYKLLVGKE